MMLSSYKYYPYFDWYKEAGMESLARTDREVQELSELWRGLRRLARESELNSVGQGGGYRKEDHIAWKAADWIARLEARAILNNAEGDSL